MSGKATRRRERLQKRTRFDAIGEYVGRRVKIEADVTRRGSALEDGERFMTLLLHDVKTTSPKRGVVSDHVWVRVPSGTMEIPDRGDRISFSAEVREYSTDYSGRDKTAASDVGLFDLSDLRIVSSWND